MKHVNMGVYKYREALVLHKCPNRLCQRLDVSSESFVNDAKEAATYAGEIVVDFGSAAINQDKVYKLCSI